MSLKTKRVCGNQIFERAVWYMYLGGQGVHVHMCAFHRAECIGEGSVNIC